MQLLSSHLDQVVFRETWRVVAAAANRMLYNDVSIQAVFSQEVSLSESETSPRACRGAAVSRPFSEHSHSGGQQACTAMSLHEARSKPV